MQRFAQARLAAAAALAAAFVAVPAMAADGSIDFHGGSVAFIGAVNWGGGTLHFRGRNIALKVRGLGIGAIGASKFSAVGRVYHLRHAHDIVGTYTAINAQATAGAGAGEIDMQNEHGVEIRARSASAGLELSLAPTGVVIDYK